MYRETINNDRIYVLHEFLSPQECHDLIGQSESLGYLDAPITTSAGFVMRKDIRNNDRVIFCLLYTSPSPRDATLSRMPSSA